jgi:hypothetical protein
MQTLGLTSNYMELSSSWEAASWAATQGLPSILWNPKVHYRVQKSLTWARSIQSIKPNPIYLRTILTFFTHLRLGLPSGLFPSGFLLISYCIPLLLYSYYIPCSSHPSWHDHSTNFGITSRKYAVVGISSSENYTEKCITSLHKYYFITSTSLTTLAEIFKEEKLTSVLFATYVVFFPLRNFLVENCLLATH